MKLQAQIILTICFPVYLALVLLTDISLTGFWTDVIFTILLSILSLRLVFKSKTNNRWLTVILKATNILCLLIVFRIVGLCLLNPFTIDTLKLRSFYFLSVNDRLFNAYFKPVGAYSGGYGNFWINECPKYFPLIEKRIYWDRTVHHDFNDNTFEGEPVNNREVARSYIKDNVIEKQQ